MKEAQHVCTSATASIRRPLVGPDDPPERELAAAALGIMATAALAVRLGARQGAQAVTPPGHLPRS